MMDDGGSRQKVLNSLGLKKRGVLVEPGRYRY